MSDAMEIDDIFRNSAKIVLRFFGLELHRTTKIDPKDLDFNTNISAYVGITGNPLGLVSFELEKDIALIITSKILNKKQTEFNEYNKEIIREITNQICGGAITELWQYGYSADITPPSLITGDKIVFYHSKNCKESFYQIELESSKVVLKTFLELK